MRLNPKFLEIEAIRVRLIRCLDAAILLQENNFLTNEELNEVKDEIRREAMRNGIKPEYLE